jgi:hypothetical protein
MRGGTGNRSREITWPAAAEALSWDDASFDIGDGGIDFCIDLE